MILRGSSQGRQLAAVLAFAPIPAFLLLVFGMAAMPAALYSVLTVTTLLLYAAAAVMFLRDAHVHPDTHAASWFVAWLLLSGLTVWPTYYLLHVRKKRAAETSSSVA